MVVLIHDVAAFEIARCPWNSHFIVSLHILESTAIIAVFVAFDKLFST
jgi:hypothetical protein